MAFHVGQKVVCVRIVEIRKRNPTLTFPEVGQIYTVRGFSMGDPTALLLVEIEHQDGPLIDFNKVFVGWGEPGFDCERFRPLQEQGMSILRAIAANPKRELEVA